MRYGDLQDSMLTYAVMVGCYSCSEVDRKQDRNYTLTSDA